MTEPITIDAEITGELSAPLRLRAERYRDHVRASGEEAVKAFEELAGARREAAHGEWGLFLQDAGIDDTTARVQLQLYEQMQADPRFGERFRQGWLTQGAGRELLSAPAEVKEQILTRPADSRPPTVAEVREAKKAAAPNRATSHGSPKVAPAPVPAAPTKTPLEITPLTPAAPAGPSTVIATVPASGGLPPMLQLGAPAAPAALPSPLFAPPPAANPAPAEEFERLQAAMSAAGHALAYSPTERHFIVHKGGAIDSYYLAADWDGCRRRCEYLLNPPPPVAAAATLAEPDIVTDDDNTPWAEVDDEDGAAVMVRATGLTPVVAEAIAQAAEALRLIALGQFHAVDTALLADMAEMVEREPGQSRGVLRTVLRMVADEADEVARLSSTLGTTLTLADEAPAEDLSTAAGLSIALTEGEHSPTPDDVARWQGALDALAPELDDPTYEGLAHRLGALREAARAAS